MIITIRVFIPSFQGRLAEVQPAIFYLKQTVMPQTINDRPALVKEILQASSREEVRILIERNFASAPAGFMEMIAGELGSFSPMYEQVQQWSNIRIARILIHRGIKQAKRNLIQEAS